MSGTLDIAWIGLGEMGARMAPRLAAKGHHVAAFDTSPAALARAQAAGITPAAGLAPALAGRQVAVSMIPNDRALVEIASRAAELLADGATFIDMSTVSPKASAEAAAHLARTGIGYLRAPVSGSTGLAEAGTLTVLASGPRGVFEQRLPLLEALGRTVRYLGPGEEARVAKLVINTVVAGLNQAVAEALDLGRRGGLDWAAMVDLLGQSAVASPYVASKAERLKQRDWLVPAAPVSLIAKDVRLALDLGREVGAFMPATNSANAVLAAMEGRALGALDMCAVVSFLEGA